MNLFKKIILLFSISLFALIGCNTSSTENLEDEQEESLYGGIFSIPRKHYFSNVLIHQVELLETVQAYNQIFEGLVKYNPKTLEVESALASDWTISEDGLVYTFTLKEDVFFHDNSCFDGGKGRKLTGDDVLSSFEKIYASDAQNKNTSYTLFKGTILGGDAYFNGESESIEGIAVNGNTVSITIEKPSAGFILKLATFYGLIYPKEALTAEKFSLVGTGPFVYSAEESNSEKVILKRNENYHEKDEKGNKLPYLDGISFIYFDDKEERMEMFWNKELTYVPSVPISKISEVLEERISDFNSKPPKYKLLTEPQLSTKYIQFNMLSPTLKNKKVRQAISYAINRNKFVEKIMKNQAYDIGKYGLTPPVSRTIQKYDYKGIEAASYSYNPDTAKMLFAAAGFPNGEGFPTLSMQFSSSGTQQFQVASEIQRQLRSVLNINVEIEAIAADRILENRAMAKADIFSSTWIGDYPSPETFLANAYGAVVPQDPTLPSRSNTARYKSDSFDDFFEKGNQSGTTEEAYKNYAEAEKIMMQDAPFIILWYAEDMKLIQASVRNFQSNPMRYLDLKKVYLKDPTAAEYAEKARTKE